MLARFTLPCLAITHFCVVWLDDGLQDLGDLAMVARCERTAQAGSSPE